MSTTTTSNGKPQRSIGVVGREGEWFLLELFDGRKPEADYYICRKVPSDWGSAYSVERQDGIGTAETYYVLLDGPRSVCDCPGHCYAGHCKHWRGLLALAAAGRLPGFQANAPLDPRFHPDRNEQPRRESPWRSAGDYAANDPTGWEQHCLDIEGPDDAA